MRTFIDWAQSQGYRLAVLNHIGALENEIISSPRIFTYGMYNEFYYSHSLMSGDNSTQLYTRYQRV